MQRSRALTRAKARLSAPEASRGRKPRLAETILPPDATLVDVVDNLLNKGVILDAEVILALADVDLVYLRLSTLLAAADRVTGGPRRRR